MICHLIGKLFKYFVHIKIASHMMVSSFIEANCFFIYKLKLFPDEKLLCLDQTNLSIYNIYNKKLLCSISAENYNNIEIISQNDFILYNNNSFKLYHYEDNSDFGLFDCYQVFRYDIPFNNYRINNIYYRKKNIFCFGNNILFLNIFNNYKIEIKTVIKDVRLPGITFYGFLLNDKKAIIIRYTGMDMLDTIEFCDIKNKYKLIKTINNTNLKCGKYGVDFIFHNLNNNDEFLICNYMNIWKFSFNKKKLISLYKNNFPMRKIIFSNKAIYGISRDSFFCVYDSDAHRFRETNFINYDFYDGFHNFIIDKDENILCAKGHKIYHLITGNSEKNLAEIIMLILNFIGSLLYFKYYKNIKMTIIRYFLIFLFSPVFLQFIDFGKANFVFNKEERIRNNKYIASILCFWIIYLIFEMILTFVLICVRLWYFNPLHKSNVDIPVLAPLLSNSNS